MPNCAVNATPAARPSAANLRREEGLIRYSASSAVLPLPEGAQNVISWWLQLAALASTARSVGRAVELVIASTRGEAAPWHFEWRSREEGLWHCRREARQEWASALELWLDPPHHVLPVRLMSGDPTRRGWLLELKSAVPP
ncbi:hypothetical protein ACFJGW_04480 [Burkholderiaceae bacterium UC74_6]